MGGRDIGEENKETCTSKQEVLSRVYTLSFIAHKFIDTYYCFFNKNENSTTTPPDRGKKSESRLCFSVTG